MLLGACPRIRRGRVPSTVPPAALLAGADARRRDAGDVAVHRRGAPTQQMPPRRRNPKGAWGLHGDRCVARRQRCAPTSPPPRALRSPRKPHVRATPPNSRTGSSWSSFSRHSRKSLFLQLCSSSTSSSLPKMWIISSLTTSSCVRQGCSSRLDPTLAVMDSDTGGSFAVRDFAFL
jgi:hypothetical protein